MTPARSAVSNVLITGITSCESRGVEALARTIAEQLINTEGVNKVTVLTQTPALDEGALAPTGARCVADPFVVSRSWQQMRPQESPAELTARGAQLLAETDLVVATGGDLYTSDYGVSRPYLRVLTAAQQRDIPTAMIGQSVGPFDDPSDAEAWITVAARCHLLTVRESLSHGYLVGKLGLPEHRVQLSSDPAFLLPTATGERTSAVLRPLGLTPQDPYICLAPSQGITRFSALEEAQHATAVTRLATALARTWRIPVVLVPHCHDSRRHNDDRILAAHIAEAAGMSQVMTLPGALTASDYKGVLSRAELVISERLHSAIGALSSGVPAIAIGHSHKFNGVLAETYGDTVDVDDIHADVRAFTEDITVTDRIVHDTDAAVLRTALQQRLPLITDRARSDFAQINSLLGA
ncbi:polysaccharide pyruvyl transferase family protein [Streptomyces sp. ME19-01-6]|uniref:polysaccharide pyruvyl transferase family protein n=1 Tax=Streptomyces sp. ME19-01-6 TaxID=3028686 RepID=UPI0029B2E42A|nr:polysaccharide pyruvyl transferase family protein [Streptomyces sp. ME19-01-6]MDX3224517.1 polysaccharide pyruvyl transferase family protein [Streptomyces sp. ME19-01-6]